MKLCDCSTTAFPVHELYLEFNRYMSIINLKTKLETLCDLLELIKQSCCRQAPYKVIPVEIDSIKG